MASDEAQATLLEILIAELHRDGTLDGENLTNMARRMEEAGFPNEASGVLFIPFANAMDSPEERRALMGVVPPLDGGNVPD